MLLFSLIGNLAVIQAFQSLGSFNRVVVLARARASSSLPPRNCAGHELPQSQCCSIAPRRAISTYTSTQLRHRRHPPPLPAELLNHRSTPLLRVVESLEAGLDVARKLCSKHKNTHKASTNKQAFICHSVLDALISSPPRQYLLARSASLLCCISRLLLRPSNKECSVKCVTASVDTSIHKNVPSAVDPLTSFPSITRVFLRPKSTRIFVSSAWATDPLTHPVTIMASVYISSDDGIP